MTRSTANKCRILGVIGRSGSGKGTFVKAFCRKWRKGILVWSPLEATDQYAQVIGGVRVSSVAELVAALKAGKKRIVMQPSIDPKVIKVQFDRFCRVAWELDGWMVIVEELSRVTMASWAPIPWKNLSTAGRHGGMFLIGTSQRPAQVDKDFLGNCSEIRSYGVGSKRDAVAMADVLFCDWKEIIGLPLGHYLHRYVDTNKVERGVVVLQDPLKKPTKKQSAAPDARLEKAA